MSCVAGLEWLRTWVWEWVQTSYSLASPHTASLVCDEKFACLEFSWIKGMLETWKIDCVILYLLDVIKLASFFPSRATTSLTIWLRLPIMTEPNVTIVSDLRCLHLPRLLENYAPAAEPLPTSDDDLEHLFRITSIERLQTLTIDDIKKEIQMIMWAHYEVDVCRKDFVLLLDTLRSAANDDSKNQLVKVDHCDSVAAVLRQWEMPCGTAAEGVRIRFDPCWKNYVQLTSCTWRPFARPLRHQWKSLAGCVAVYHHHCGENHHNNHIVLIECVCACLCVCVCVCLCVCVLVCLFVCVC